MKVLKQKNTLKLITNTETYLELCQISKMELFGFIYFRQKATS